MAEKKKSGKFFTSILIGGALGSAVAWVFGSKKRREKVSEKAQQYYQQVESALQSHPPECRSVNILHRILDFLRRR